MRFLKARNIPTLSADNINSTLLQQCHLISSWLTQALNIPLDLSSPSGKVALGTAISNDSGNKRMTESMLHPVILQNINLRSSISSNTIPIAIEIPLLYEAGLEDQFGKVVLMVSGESEVKNRIKKRSTAGQLSAQQLLSMQDRGAHRYKTSNAIIINNLTESHLKRSSSNLLNTGIFTP